MTQLDVAQRWRPAQGEQACGDWAGHWSAGPEGPHWLVLIDGLGHGPLARVAAEAAQAALWSALAQDPGWRGRPGALLATLGPQLAGTRGAAVALACLHQGHLWHAGIGNVRSRWWHAGQWHSLPSAWGILGAPAPRGQRLQGAPADTSMSVAAGDGLLMFSDGLAENLRVSVLPAAWQAEPARLCEHLLQTEHIPRDDAAVQMAWVRDP